MKTIDGGVKGNPARLALAVLAVALGMAFVSGAFFVRSSVAATVGSLADSLASADVYVRPIGASGADLLLKPRHEQTFVPPSVQPVVTGAVGDNVVNPVYVAQLILLDKDGKAVETGWAPSIGIGFFEDQPGLATVVDGKLPATVKQVALEAGTAAKAGLGVGDKAPMIINGQNQEFEISGIVSYPAPLRGSALVILNPTVARAWFSPTGEMGLLAVTATSGDSPQKLKDAITAALGPDTTSEAVLGTQLRQEIVTQAGDMFRLAYLAAALLGVAGALVAGFAVLNIFAGAQRRYAAQTALLQDLGASTGQIVSPVVGQAVVVGLAGSVAGCLGGFGLAAGFAAFVSGQGLQASVGVPWLGFVVSLLAGVAVALAGAWFGAARTVTTGRLGEAGVARPGKSRFAPLWTLLGLVLIVGGIAVAVVGFQGVHDLAVIITGLVVMVLGTALAGPVFFNPVAGILSAPVRLLSPLVGRLVKAEVTGGSRRAANVAGVFVVSMAVAASMLTLANGMGESSEKALNFEMTADYVIRSEQPAGVVPDAVLTQMRQIPDAVVLAFGRAPAEIESGDSGSYSPVNVYYGPTQAFVQLLAGTIIQGGPEAFIGGAAVDKAYAVSHGIKLGDTLHFRLAAGSVNEILAEIPVALIFDTVMFKDILVPNEWLGAQIPGQARSQFMPATMVLASSTSQTGAGSLGAELEKVAGGNQKLVITPKSDFVTAPDPLATQTTVAAYLLVAICLVVALLAVVNAFGFSVTERRREIAMLKTLGASDGQIRGSLVVQAGLICAAGSVIGVILGLILSVVGQAALGVGTGGRGNLALGSFWTTVPWLTLVVLFLASWVFVSLVATGPANRAGRLPLREPAGA